MEKIETRIDHYGFCPDVNAWDGNLILAGEKLPYGDRDMYFLTCTWCLQKEFWRFKSTSPEMWVANEEFHTYPFPAWVCDACQSFLGKYAAAPAGDYDEYLRSPHWERIRARALFRAANRCQLCASLKRLDVHHNTYENLGHERPEDVIVLCRMCHEKHHNKRSS